MGRPRLTIGSFGDITTRILPSERFEARTRYRDWDGRSRIVQATAKAAERELKKKLAGRSVFYRLENEHARQLVSDAIFQAEHSLGGVPRHHHEQLGDLA